MVDLDLRVKPRDPEASIRVALCDVRPTPGEPTIGLRHLKYNFAVGTASARVSVRKTLPARKGKRTDCRARQKIPPFSPHV